MSSLPPSPVAHAFSGIQWDPMVKLRLTNSEMNLLRSAEVNPIDYTLCNSEESATYVKVVLKVLAEASGASGPSSKVSHVKSLLPEEEALQMLYTDPLGVVTHYAITKLYDIIVCLKEKKRGSGVSMGSTFFNESDGSLIDEWRPLLRVLHLGGSGDAFAQRGAAYCLAYILMAGCPSQRFSTDRSIKINHVSVEEPLQALISWITSQLQSSGSSSLSLVTPTLTALVSCPEARIKFANSGGIGYLSRHLRNGTKGSKSSATVQQLYELCFCVWALTYECNSSATVRVTFARDNAVHSLVDLVSSAPREKVVRVALSALRSLAQCTADAAPSASGKKEVTGSTFLNEMIGCGLIKYVDQMRERQWTDPDIVEDLDVLHKLLHDNFKEMSTWDVYLAEVQSGSLEWGFLHTEKFFKENAQKFEGPDGDFFVVKLLVALTTSNDEEVQAIACYDIGEFVRHYPNGRSIARSLGAKDIVMKLVDHQNKELQRHALTAVSKMMVQNWAAVH
mmetsp:Transcript_6387/g.11372  ORF Transcript_6387/g.11372 Transcript_6387/m.11372 type:complete len:507 (-) Transcript_6387:210-1730(-)|eukprot:CAMPEP_0183706364 /NCGR_PEP_ID=MMETSP0737-20130205/3232_1 /TAXON_ID=385413 /ORGANISM="Thalassiosira miniscula, Strain CCMP1093" /LENGTH=506 /DNA_ID=CAMNT_0025933775 /DNA_START=111 /DNA_END=1631 /DNA_ORIENTATION=+